MVIVHSWKSLQTTFPSRALEWFFGMAMLNLGMIFLLNPGLFAGSKGWNGMAEYAEQETWSLICIGVGLTRLSALMVNGLYFRTPLIRSVMAFASCFVWWQIGVGLISNFGLGAAFIPLCFVFDVYNAARCGREAGLSEFVHRLRRDSEKRHAGRPLG